MKMKPCGITTLDSTTQSRTRPLYAKPNSLCRVVVSIIELDSTLLVGGHPLRYLTFYR